MQTLSVTLLCKFDLGAVSTALLVLRIRGLGLWRDSDGSL